MTINDDPPPTAKPKPSSLPSWKSSSPSTKSTKSKYFLFFFVIILIMIGGALSFLSLTRNVKRMVDDPEDNTQEDQRALTTTYNKKTSVVLFTIVKREQEYIADWVKYHLSYGFDRIYLYENEEVPFYAKLLLDAGVKGVRSSACAMQWPVGRCPGDDDIVDDDSVKVVVKHSPKYLYASKIRNKVPTAPHFMMFDDFDLNYAHIHKATHVTNFDIDEYLLLKKHNNITEFVDEYLPLNNVNATTKHCGAINLHWLFFGDSNITKPDKSIPVPLRFVRRGTSATSVGKVIMRNDLGRYANPHLVHWRRPGMSICNTNGQPYEPYSEAAKNITTVDVLQLNHYYTKTWEEFKYFKMRGRSNTVDMDFTLKDYKYYYDLANQNDVVDTTVADLFTEFVTKNSMNVSSLTTPSSP